MGVVTFYSEAAFAVVASRPTRLEELTWRTLASGLECTGVRSGLELAHSLERSTPDLLILDIDLDGRHGGLDLLRDARISTTVTTILMADRIDGETLALVRQVRVAGFLAWPFSQAQLDATLCIALASSRSDAGIVEHQLSQARSALRRIVRELEQVRHIVPTPEAEPRLRPLPGLSELSAREWDVLLGLLDHKRVPALARALHISPHTVRNHLKSIFTKLDVHSQAELLDKVIDRPA